MRILHGNNQLTVPITPKRTEESGANYDAGQFLGAASVDFLLHNGAMKSASSSRTGKIFPTEIELRDGSKVLIRPVTPDDKHLIEIGLAHLSKEGRYFRFFRPISKLSDKMLREFTEIDHIDHEAIGALGTGSQNGLPLGVARYIRIPHEPTTAEVAVTVTDGQQGKGLGTLLLAFLACRAAANGVADFCAFVLADNHRMLALFRELGSTTETGAAGEVEVRIPLFADASSYPETPAGHVVRKVSALLAANG